MTNHQLINALTPTMVTFTFSMREESVIQRLTTEVRQHSEQKYIFIHCPATEAMPLLKDYMTCVSERSACFI